MTKEEIEAGANALGERLAERVDAEIRRIAGLPMAPRQALGGAMAAAERALELVKTVAPGSVESRVWTDVADARSSLKDVVTFLRRAKERTP